MRALFLLLLAFCWVTPTWGAQEVLVQQIWMRESVPGQTAATVQLNLYLTKAATLLGVSSPLATTGEIRHVVSRGGKMQQRPLRKLKLAAHSNTLFGERGLYLMLIGLKQRLNVGDKILVILSLKMDGKTRDVKVEAEVRALELSYKHYNDPAVMDHQ